MLISFTQLARLNKQKAPLQNVIQHLPITGKASSDSDFIIPQVINLVAQQDVNNSVDAEAIPAIPSVESAIQASAILETTVASKIENTENSPVSTEVSTDAPIESSTRKAKKSKAKIEDFGEALHGAKKMTRMQGYLERIKQIEFKHQDYQQDGLSLDKLWPEPNYQELLDDGIQLERVSLVRAIREHIARTRKPAVRRNRYWSAETWFKSVCNMRSNCIAILNGELTADQVFLSYEAQNHIKEQGLMFRYSQGEREKLPFYRLYEIDDGANAMRNTMNVYNTMGHNLTWSKNVKVSFDYFKKHKGIEYPEGTLVWTIECTPYDNLKVWGATEPFTENFWRDPATNRYQNSDRSFLSEKECFDYLKERCSLGQKMRDEKQREAQAQYESELEAIKLAKAIEKDRADNLAQSTEQSDTPATDESTVKVDEKPDKKRKFADFRLWNFPAEGLQMGVRHKGQIIKLIDPTKAGLASKDEIWKFMRSDEGRNQLQDAFDAYLFIPNERYDSNQDRVGQAWRGPDLFHAKAFDITPEMFEKEFGFRGVQFGNYVNSKQRQVDINKAYDSLMDLASVLNLPPKALSLNGSLGLAFGARGNGGRNPAAAHYEPSNIVINLTKNGGAGSLAHEWWHALDHHLSIKNKSAMGYITEAPHLIGRDGLRRDLVEYINSLSIQFDGYTNSKTPNLLSRSKKIDARKGGDYWAKKREVMARSFEGYIKEKLAQQHYKNDYLVNFRSFADYAKPEEYPYPDNSEIATVVKNFDDVFQELRHEKSPDSDNVVLFSFGGQKAATMSEPQLQKAVTLEAEGKNTEHIRRRTGWFRGIDKKWRFEINDSDASLLVSETSFHKTFNTTGTVGDLLKHDALFAAYPAIGDYVVNLCIDSNDKSNNGYLEVGKDIKGNSPYDETIIHIKAESKHEALKALMHEIQHAIQFVEGFALGSTVSRFEKMDKSLFAIRQKANIAAMKERFDLTDEYIEEMEARREQSGYAHYMNSAGEIESRNVETRLKFSDHSRRLYSPASTLDTNESQAIISFNSKDMMIQKFNIPSNLVSMNIKDDFIDAIINKMPEQSENIETMLHRGKNGLRGGLVILSADDIADIEKYFKTVTGNDILLPASQIKKMQASSGFYDQKSGITFLSAVNINYLNASAILMHEVCHSQSNDAINAAALKMIQSRHSTQYPDHVRDILNAANTAMEKAGEGNNNEEATAHIVEMACMCAKKAGFDRVNDKAGTWVHKFLGSKIGDWFDAVVNKTRITAIKMGLPINPKIEDFVNYAKYGIANCIQGNVKISKTPFDIIEHVKKFNPVDNLHSAGCKYDF